MTANDLVIKCSSLRWVCLDVRKGPLVFMIPEGGPTLLKAVCAVCLDLNVATAFRSNTCRTYIWEPVPPKAATGNVCCRPYIDKHMGGGRRLMQKLARCQLHFCGFSYSLSVEFVYVHADTLVGYLTGLDLSLLTWLWLMCGPSVNMSVLENTQHVWTTPMQTPTPVVRVCSLSISFLCVWRSSLPSFYYYTFAFKMKDKKGHRNVSILWKETLTSDHQADGEAHAPWPFRHFKDSPRLWF